MLYRLSWPGAYRLLYYCTYKLNQSGTHRSRRETHFFITLNRNTGEQVNIFEFGLIDGFMYIGAHAHTYSQNFPTSGFVGKRGFVSHMGKKK
jgi:hypothetical protein